MGIKSPASRLFAQPFVQKLRVTGLCEGNSPVASGFASQRVGNAENVSIWWRHQNIGSSSNVWWYSHQKVRKEHTLSSAAIRVIFDPLWTNAVYVYFFARKWKLVFVMNHVIIVQNTIARTREDWFQLNTTILSLIQGRPPPHYRDRPLPTFAPAWNQHRAGSKWIIQEGVTRCFWVANMYRMFLALSVFSINWPIALTWINNTMGKKQ